MPEPAQIVLAPRNLNTGETEMPTVYEKLEPASAVIEAFHADFTFHDLRSFKLCKNGDTAIWSAGKCGTHLAFTHLEGVPCNREHVRAVISEYGKNPIWRRIEFTGPNSGRVVKLKQVPEF